MLCGDPSGQVTLKNSDEWHSVQRPRRKIAAPTVAQRRDRAEIVIARASQAGVALAVSSVGHCGGAVADSVAKRRLSNCLDELRSTRGRDLFRNCAAALHCVTADFCALSKISGECSAMSLRKS